MSTTVHAMSTLSAALIDDLLRYASVGTDPQTLTVRAPFTAEPLVELPLADAVAVEAAAERARVAQREWAERDIAERARIILRFHDLVLAGREEAMDVVQAENGKARRDALEEVLDVAVTARHYARDARRLLRPRRHRGVFPGLVGVQELRHPKGIVGIIAPWNYPLTLAASDAVPALLAGNAVLLKPDPQTTLCALWAARCLVRAGLPADLFQVLPGEGATVGPLVIDCSDAVMFTGSTPVGRRVAEQCAKRLISCSLELGGKNALIVRGDANADTAAEKAVRACFANSGQLCVAAERIYVHTSRYEEFLAAFAARTTALRLQAGVGWGADVGSLISARQLERVRAHVDDAVRLGATVVVGGLVRPDIGPYFYEPTVLTGVSEAMVLCAEETFGPVVSVFPVADDDEAVRRANDTAYGLNASVVTGSARMGRRIARRLHAGTVNINEGYAAAWGSVRAPMGGMGDSGIGRRHGDEGLLKYTEAQTIATQRWLGFQPLFGLSDQAWGGVLARAVSAMKRLGIR